MHLAWFLIYEFSGFVDTKPEQMAQDLALWAFIDMLQIGGQGHFN